jgi:DNA-directed RNA polymerase specialized sigma24 family protein
LDSAYSVPRWLSRSPAEADDLVQDAILRTVDGFRSTDARLGYWPLRNFWFSAGTVAQLRGHISLKDENLIADGIDPQERALQEGARRKLTAIIAPLPKNSLESRL